MYIVLNKQYEVVFKGKNLSELYEYIEKLHIKHLTDKYVGRELDFTELSSIYYEYRNFNELSQLFFDYQENEIFIDKYIYDLRQHLNNFDLLLAF